MNWFDVDRTGLEKLVAEKPKIWIVHELLANAWDESGVTTVQVCLRPIPSKPFADLSVMDDAPHGFQRFADAWTLFAESYKKGDAERRGRFNLGEKLVLACCANAEIHSNGQKVVFDAGGRHLGHSQVSRGTLFSAVIRLTREQITEIESQIGLLIPPPHIITTFNGLALKPREPITSFEAVLPTVHGETLASIKRLTTVTVYPVPTGEKAMVYEMGIPVVETSDTFHVNVGQKVPLNMDRDNVTPSFLRTLRVEVVNHTVHLMSKERAASTEVQEATSDQRADPTAVNAMLTQRFGEKRFTFDPSDPEANNRLVSEGYVPIMGGSLNATQWQNVKEHNLALAAGVISPSPKPYSEGGRPEHVILRKDWTTSMRQVADWMEKVGFALLDQPIDVKIVSEPQAHWRANYGPGSPLTLNLAHLGYKWFDMFLLHMDDGVALLIHELGHHYSMDHLSEDYYRALTRLAGKAVVLATQKPGLFGLEPVQD